jgi:hypothetical protein
MAEGPAEQAGVIFGRLLSRDLVVLYFAAIFPRNTVIEARGRS